jgi:hypothetical protein
MTIDVARSQDMATVYRTKNQECFTNAMMVVAAQWPGTRLRYVEGWATTKWGIVVEHGWVQAGERVLEVTPIWLEAAVEGEEREYYPVLSLTRSQLLREARKPEAITPFSGWGGSLHRRYMEESRRIYKQAMASLYGEGVVKRLYSTEEAA